MRRWSVLSVVVIMMVWAGVVTGQEPSQDHGDQAAASMPGMMAGMKDGTKGPGNPMHKMMMAKMMEKTMVPTKDGGVIILVGNRLLKYDQDLNLKKEVEIKMPCSEEMKKRMKDCPMMGKMKADSGDKAPEGAAASSGAAE